MEHLIIEQINENLVRITAEEGYELLNLRTKRVNSEAKVRPNMIKYYAARPIV